MTDALLAELVAARQARTACTLVTVAATSGSVPRAAGSKMLVYGSGRISGTIGGGKFEALVAEDALSLLRQKEPALKTYPLREGECASFGAICGGEVTVLIEPQRPMKPFTIFGMNMTTPRIALWSVPSVAIGSIAIVMPAFRRMP